jgi:anti-sigma regulatory factor (Ser/Thr protein kinase)
VIGYQLSAWVGSLGTRPRRARRVVDDVPSVHLDMELPAEAGSVSRARHLLEGVPGLAGHQPLLLDMRLALSEMVTNGIRHGTRSSAELVEVTIDVDGRRVRIEVRDPGAGFDPAGRTDLPPSHSTAGRGLHLVDALANRWGVELASGTLVWAEFDLV